MCLEKRNTSLNIGLNRPENCHKKCLTCKIATKRFFLDVYLVFSLFRRFNSSFMSESSSATIKAQIKLFLVKYIAYAFDHISA